MIIMTMIDHYHFLITSTTTTTSSSLIRLLLMSLLCLVLGLQYYEIFNFDIHQLDLASLANQNGLKKIGDSKIKAVDDEEEELQYQSSTTTDSLVSSQKSGTAASSSPQPLSSSSSSSSRNNKEWTVTFVGDIMFSTKPLNWPERTINVNWTMGESLDNLIPLRGDYIIGNLEGLITDVPLKEDPNGRGANYSFAMPPGAELILKNKLHLNATSQANNHVGDRNVRGYEDTKRHLDSVGIAHFGAGITPNEQAIPHTFVTPFGQTVGISSFHADTKCIYFKIYHENDPNHHHRRKKVRTALDPGNSTHVQLAMKLQQQAKTDIRIAFVHWGPNYKPLTDKVSKEYAPLLASAGYDLIIGSAGTHTVQPIDFVEGVPVFYDIGNFILEKANRFHYVKNLEPEKYHTSLPYGAVAHVVFDSDGPKRLEIRCTLVDNDIVKCKPRYCNVDESFELFSSLGEYINYTKGNTYATVDLRTMTRKKKANNIIENAKTNNVTVNA